MISRWRMLRVVLGLMVVLFPACIVAADSSQRGSSSPVTTIRRSQSALMSLAREDVCKDLELVDEQLQSVSELISRVPKRLIELMAGLAELPEAERRARIKQFKDQQQRDIERVLLPHQVKRLRQIGFQFRINSRDVGNALTSAEVVEALAITGEQLEHLRTIQPDVEIAYREQLLRVRQEAVGRMLAELTPAQRQKWKELAGSLFIEDAGSDEQDAEKMFR